MSQDDLRRRIATYLVSHHTMTVATVGPVPTQPPHPALPELPQAALPQSPQRAALPHAASVFYVADALLRLVFLSRPSSTHGLHIGRAAPVAVTVTEQYADWEIIQGVQIWGDARLLGGATRAAAMAAYVARFPFVVDLMKRRGPADLISGVGVYRITPQRFAFTDNTTGVFGREVLEADEFS